MDGDTFYSIGDLARRTGLTVKAIRFYSDRGIVPPTDRSPAGYRRYDIDAVARLDLVRTLRDLGLDLPTIRRVVDRGISASDARGYTTNYTYDNAGNLTSTIDPRGVATTNNYDEAGHIPTGAAGVLDLTSTTVTQLGQSAEIKDSNPATLPSRTTNYYYDDAAHPADRTRTVDPNSNTTTATYDSFGNPTSTTDALGNKAQRGYDTSKGWLTSTVTPTGTAAGVNPGCAPPAMGCTTFAHDAWGHVTATTDALGHTTTVSYDANGNQASAVDANAKTTTYTYNFANQLTKTTQPDSTTLVTDYNLDGTVADTIDAASNKTSYSYDGQARKVSRTDPDNRVWKTGYDKAVNQTSTTNPANQTTTYGYDPANDLTSVTYSDGTTPKVTYTYNSARQRASMTDGTGTSTWSYDAFGEVTGLTQGSGAKVSFGYDNAGNHTSITYPGATTQTVTQTFDNANRLASLTDWNNKKTTFGYTADSLLTTTSYPNGTTVTNGFDNGDALATSTLTAGTTPLASLAYTRDNANQLTGSTPTGVPGSAQTYSYTPREQLASATSGSTTTPFTYDAANNPTTVGGTAQAFDPAGQLCWSLPSGTPGACASPPVGATTYTLDTNGRRTKTTPATGAASTYGYDQANRLTSTTTPAGSATYTYNGDGLRTAKTVGSTTTAFTWDAASVPNLLSDGTTSYVYGPNGLPLEQISGTTTLWFFHDQIGSTRALIDTTGTIVGTYAYTPYGAVTSHAGTASTPLQYTGQYTDTETSFVYLRARYYDPITAQFLTIDPAVEQTLSPYGYVADNPLNLTDPTGRCWSWVPSWACNGARYAVDIVAFVPYTIYWANYEVAKGINSIGAKFGPAGSVVSHILNLPSVIPQAAGLGADAGIDWFKNATGLTPESMWDEGGKPKYINPSHGWLPDKLKGPKWQLPGCREDGGIDLEW